MSSDERLFIWVMNWEKHQSYSVKRGKPWAPPWIKLYPDLLDDLEFLSLSPESRSLLVGIWALFARCRGTLAKDTRNLSRQLSQRVTERQLQRLSDAGFICFCSGTVREQFWNVFWTGSALEVEVEVETPLPPSGETPQTRAEAEPAQVKLLDVAVPLEDEETPEERRRIAEQIRQQFSKIGRPMNGNAGETETDPHPGPALQVAESWEPVDPAADEGHSSDWVTDESEEGA